MSLDEQTITISPSLCDRLRREIGGIKRLLCESMASPDWTETRDAITLRLKGIAAELYAAEEHALADRTRHLAYDLRLWLPSLADAACDVLTRLVALERKMSDDSLRASCDEMRALWAGWRSENASAGEPTPQK